MKKRFFSMMLAIVMLLGILPMSVFAVEDSPSYVVLGDSISTGYGLADYTVGTVPTNSFSYIIADTLGYELTNLAADGNTAAGILAQMQSEDVKSAVANADFITITAGGNDLMNVLYDAIAADYNSKKGTNFTGKDVMNEFADGSSTDMSFGIMELGSLAQIVTNFASSSTFLSALDDYGDAMFGNEGIIENILSLNPDVTVIVPTQYNPYLVFSGGSSMYSFLYTGIEAGVQALNEVIQENAEGKYIVADVYKEFADSTDNLCNAQDSNLDFHPNAAGHALIADTFMEILTSYNTVVEASWGASAKNLTNNGTLLKAIAAAASDGTIKYIQLTNNVTTEEEFLISTGEFTLDLNSYTVTCTGASNAKPAVFNVETDASTYKNTVNITFTDNSEDGDGAVVSENGPAVKVNAYALDDDVKVVLEKGNYNGNTSGLLVNTKNSKVTVQDGVSISSTNAFGSAVAINGGVLTMNGGTLSHKGSAHFDFGARTATDATIDFSNHDNPDGLTIYANRTMPVSQVKLPNDYGIYDAQNNGYTTGNVPSSTQVTIKSTKIVIYNAAVVNGTGSGDYKAGDTVTISANDAEPGYRFIGWTSEDGVTFTDATAATTTFTMIEKDVTVKANYAMTNVPYLDADGNEQICTNPTPLKSGMTTLTDGWYYVDGEVTVDSRITVSGDVHLILCDGATLTANGGIGVNSGNNLTVYGQANCTGKLIANAATKNAGIGGTDANCGNITINGGIVTATGGESAAGIGGGRRGVCTNVVINGGIVTATGGSSAAGIGSGYVSYGVLVTINGGTVTATGGSGAAGIGMCAGGSGAMTVTINGGSVKASSITTNNYMPNNSNSAKVSLVQLTVPTGYDVNNLVIKNADGTDYAYGKRDMSPDADGKLYLWLPEGVTVGLYSIDFVTNDGTINDALVYSYLPGETVELPKDVTKTGYTFAGWYEDEDFTGAPITEIGAVQTGDKTFYAQWTANQYTITFDSDGGTVIDSITQDYGTAITAPAAPTKIGFDFCGWYADSGLTTAYVFDTMPAENITVYAKWTVNIAPYIPLFIKYDIDIADGIVGGTVTTDKASEMAKGKVTITAAPLEGYEAKAVGVITSSGKSVALTDNSDGTYTFTMPMSDVTVYATFTEIEVPVDPVDPTTPDDPIDSEPCPKDSTCPVSGFSDADASEWYHDGVHYCIEHDLMKGFEDGTFRPNTATSRAMIVTILWRMEGSPVVNYLMSFEDVAADAWYTEAIRWAASEGIVEGYSDTAFGPNDIITREQLAAILYRYEQYKGGGFTGAWMIRMDYVDLADVSDWAYEAICWCTMNGIINGKPDKLLDPKGNATRAEAATMISRFLDKAK